MFIKKAIMTAYSKEFAGKEVCREVFIQAHPEGFEAILACFGTYADFLQEIVADKPVTQAPKAKVAPKVTK